MVARRSAWIPLLVFLLLLTGTGGSLSVAETSSETLTGPAVVRLYYQDRAHLDAVAGSLDIWEVNRDASYVIAQVTPNQHAWLAGLGYRMEVDDERTELLGIHAPLDPRFHYFDDEYPNANGLYVVDFLHDTHAAHPGLTELYDIGDAWLGAVGGEYNRDIWVLRITNEDPAFGPIEEKPAFFLFATIHAREVAVPELAIRYIQYLLDGYGGEGGYGVDADVTWLVNHNVLYVQVMQNPDGHRENEENTAYNRRKNMDNDDGCNDPGLWGVDLNRNSSFLWGCCGGSSGYPCEDTYRGPDPASEPETQAFQEYFSTVMLDQNGPNGDDEVPPAAPEDTTGIFISLHSYSDLVLWPWDLPGYPDAPNAAQLETIGKKFAYFNDYDPTGSIWYTVDGATEYWTYGKFGIPSYTFEVGPSGGVCGGFFPDYECIEGESGYTRNFWAENKPAFLFAHKIARTPYMTAYGPDAESVLAVPGVIAPGEPVELTATVADHRYSGDPLQPIGGAEYFIGEPGEDGSGTPMIPTDGSWGDLSEGVLAALDTTALPLGKHYILVHGQNEDGDWGPFSAAFLYIMDPGASPTIQGYVRDGSDNAPLEATVTANEFQTYSDPDTGFYSMLVISGTYDISAIASGYVTTTVTGVEVHDHEVVNQNLFPIGYCNVFEDDVESGSFGWVADAPWAITDENSHSPTHCWTDSPGGNYGPGLDISLTSQPLDFAGHSGIRLGFWHAYSLQDGGFDSGSVEYSTDGANWVEVAEYSGEHYPPVWEEEEIALPGLDDEPEAQIRFRLRTSDYVSHDGWYIDDVALYGGGPACITPEAPVAEFDSSSPVELGATMVFTNLTSGTPPFDWLWDFGDGSGTSTEMYPDYTYDAPGTYEVTLAATNSLGSGSVSHQVVVAGTCQPVEGVTLSLDSPEPLFVGAPIDMSADITPEAAGKPYTYTVDYGDGSAPVTAPSSADPLALNHLFDSAGTYEVEIAVWNCDMSQNEAVTDRLEITVVESCTELEAVELSLVSMGIHYTGDLVAFSSDVAPDDAGKPYTYVVEFDDGTQPLEGTSSADPLFFSHVFDSPGEYAVEIAAWNCGMLPAEAVTHDLQVTIEERYTIYVPVLFRSHE